MNKSIINKLILLKNGINKIIVVEFFVIVIQMINIKFLIYNFIFYSFSVRKIFKITLKILRVYKKIFNILKNNKKIYIIINTIKIATKLNMNLYNMFVNINKNHLGTLTILNKLMYNFTYINIYISIALKLSKKINQIFRWLRNQNIVNRFNRQQKILNKYIKVKLNLLKKIMYKFIYKIFFINELLLIRKILIKLIKNIIKANIWLRNLKKSYILKISKIFKKLKNFFILNRFKMIIQTTNFILLYIGEPTIFRKILINIRKFKLLIRVLKIVYKISEFCSENILPKLRKIPILNRIIGKKSLGFILVDFIHYNMRLAFLKFRANFVFIF